MKNAKASGGMAGKANRPLMRPQNGEAMTKIAKPKGIEIFTFKQNTPEWEQARCGKITASELKAVMAKSKDMRMRTTYLRKLCAEIIAEKPIEGYSNKNMERGHEMEEEARLHYEMMTGRKPTP